MEQKRQLKIFSESFKREKVKMLERGEMTSTELKTTYDVSYTSIYKWKKKFGNLSPSDKIVIEKDSDYLKVLDLTKRISEMERIIGRQQIKLDYYVTVVNHATLHYGDDIEKKFGKV